MSRIIEQNSLFMKWRYIIKIILLSKTIIILINVIILNIITKLLARNNRLRVVLEMVTQLTFTQWLPEHLFYEIPVLR